MEPLGDLLKGARVAKRGLEIGNVVFSGKHNLLKQFVWCGDGHNLPLPLDQSHSPSTYPAAGSSEETAFDVAEPSRRTTNRNRVLTVVNPGLGAGRDSGWIGIPACPRCAADSIKFSKSFRTSNSERQVSICGPLRTIRQWQQSQISAIIDRPGDNAGDYRLGVAALDLGKRFANSRGALNLFTEIDKLCR